MHNIHEYIYIYILDVEIWLKPKFCSIVLVTLMLKTPNPSSKPRVSAPKPQLQFSDMWVSLCRFLEVFVAFWNVCRSRSKLQAPGHKFQVPSSRSQAPGPKFQKTTIRFRKWQTAPDNDSKFQKTGPLEFITMSWYWRTANRPKPHEDLENDA